MLNIRKHELLLTEFLMPSEVKISPAFQQLVLDRRTGIFLGPDCGYSLELPHRGKSNEYTQCIFYGENYPRILTKYSPLTSSLSQDIVLVLFVLRFYGPVNPVGSCRAQSVYLTTCLLGKLSSLSG